LVLIDEVWEFWGADAALLPEHKKFFRMHRHYTETDSSISCDLVIMIQDLTSLNRFIKSVLETNYKFTKLKTLGWSTGYRVEVYEGNRQTKKNLVSVFIKKYDKNIFPLYQSYASGKGKEAVVDDRQNIFKNKFFVGLMILAIVVLFSSSVWFVKYIGKMRNPDVKQQQHDATQDLKQSSTSTVSTSQPVKLSSDLKMVGYLVRSDGQVIVFVQNSDGRVVRNEMKGGIIDGFGTVAGVEGKMVGFSWESNTSSKVKK
jgi:zona occludens toxin